MARARAATLGALLFVASCAHYGIVDDATSVSWGTGAGGMLVNGVRLPRKGEGFRIPPRWSQRGLNWGTDEMVRLLVHVGRRLRTYRPRMELSVADLSWRRGGPSAWHRSHQTGRDVDLIFFVEDGNGRPLRRHDSMPHFDADGRAAPEEAVPVDGKDFSRAEKPLRFDVARNWILVKELLVNPVARVQFIFVYDPLRQALLRYAQDSGEPLWLVQWASQILRQPMRAAPHDDHFHIRILCDGHDRVYGCTDYGRLHWYKRDMKHEVNRDEERILRVLELALGGQAAGHFATSALSYRGLVPL